MKIDLFATVRDITEAPRAIVILLFLKSKE